MALDIFNPKAQPLLGLDISSSSVKLVELADAGKKVYRVERYAIEPLPKDAVLDGNITNLEAVAESVKRAWKKLATRTKNVALALPAAAVITKKIVVPAGLRDEEIEVQVEAEANQYIPFALDEVNLDFQVVGPAPSSSEEVEVLIAAALCTTRSFTVGMLRVSCKSSSQAETCSGWMLSSRKTSWRPSQPKKSRTAKP